MLKKLTPFVITSLISVMLSVVTTVSVLRPSAKLSPDGEFDSAILKTDEQAAVQAVAGPIFVGLTDSQIALRALSSICRQLNGSLRCGKLQNYVYDAGKEESSGGATATFWYRPQRQYPEFYNIKTRNIVCRFRNKIWFFAIFLTKIPCKRSYSTREYFPNLK